MNDLLTTRQFLDEFELQQIALQPVALQAKLYRAFAAETKVESLKRMCNALADACDGIGSKHDQLVLEFHRRAT